MTPEDFQAVLGCLRESDPFRDLFIFAWYTGARPQECRLIEPRHVELENERVVFPAEEAKGKRTKRIIYLQGPALEIITRLMPEGREGTLFLNQRGLSWSKFAVCNRMFRLSEKLGKRIIMYGSRHGFCQRKLIQGHQVLLVAQLMGHSDATMVSKVYSHLDKTPDLLKKAWPIEVTQARRYHGNGSRR
jgi:integrase